MLRFIDDKRHYVDKITNDVKKNIKEALTQSVQSLKELLMFVGSKLDVRKFTYYIIEWKFDTKKIRN